MTRRTIGRLAVAVAITGLAGLSFTMKATGANIPNAQMFAAYYASWMVQGYDECMSPGVTTISGYAACPASSNPDDITFRLAKVYVTRTGKYILLGTGFPAGLQVRVRFDIRSSTRTGVNATFVDTTLTCAPTTCKATGFCLVAAALNTCTGGAALQTIASHRNIEVLSAELIEGPLAPTPGAVLARAGVILP